MGFDRNTQNKEYESGNAIGSILCISELYQHKGPPMQIVKEGGGPKKKNYFSAPVAVKWNSWGRRDSNS